MAKDKATTIRWAGLLIMVAGIFATIVGTWVVYGEDIEDNATDIAVNATSIEKAEEKVESQHEEFIGMSKDIEYIKTAQQEFKVDQKEMLKIIRKLEK